MLKRILQLIVRTKVYMARSMSYINMLNSVMILFLLLSGLEKYGIDIEIERFFIPVVLFSILFLVTWGYVEDRLGLWEYEQRVSQDRSKYNQKMLQAMNRIETRLELLEAKRK